MTINLHKVIEWIQTQTLWGNAFAHKHTMLCDRLFVALTKLNVFGYINTLTFAGPCQKIRLCSTMDLARPKLCKEVQKQIKKSHLETSRKVLPGDIMRTSVERQHWRWEQTLSSSLEPTFLLLVCLHMLIASNITYIHLF